MIGFLKGVFVLLLAAVVFGGGGYFTYRLYIHPEMELVQDQKSGGPAPQAFVDPTLAEYQKCLQMETAGDPLAARVTYAEFLDNYPDSSKAEEARARYGAIQTALLLSPRATPDKQVYVVKQGDVLNKVCARFKTSPELLAEINQLENTNLRVGQRLYVAPAGFSAVIDRVASKVVVLKNGDFFTQYPILGTQGNAKVGVPKKGAYTAVSAKVQDKPSWKDGQRIGFGEKGYREATRWVVLQPAGHTLYAATPEAGDAAPKPPSGYALDPDAIRELSALLRKNDPVTIR